ncbi:MAG: hypothetical protein M1457_14375, partial [bacterium]|nr:hypothetical protein [bacterium]
GAGITLHEALKAAEQLRADGIAARVIDCYSILRRDWGMTDDTTARLAAALRTWAGATPALDWLVISNLNARLEGPMRSLRGAPSNLHLAPPLPYPIWRSHLNRAALLLTDSPLAAAEALALGCPILALADRESAFEGADASPGAARQAIAPSPPAGPNIHPLIPADLTSDTLARFVTGTLAAGAPSAPAVPQSQPTGAAPAATVEAIDAWLSGF